MKVGAAVRRPERPKNQSQSDRTEPRPVLPRLPTGMSSLPTSGSETTFTHTLVQSGALAFRRLNNGEAVVLLVKKPHSKNWGIPKGNVEPHLTFAQNAAKEAFEEAGVGGNIETETAGSYRARKRKYGVKFVIQVYVYWLEVLEEANNWPEKGEREIKWCSSGDAAILLHEPLLAELCNRLNREVTV